MVSRSPSAPQKMANELTSEIDGGFFVFGDLSVKIEGEFRLKFTLYEMRKQNVVYLKTSISDRFRGKHYLEFTRVVARR